MTEYDNESFGDFTFASFTSNTQFTPPPKSIDDDGGDDDDNEWGDFIEYPTGSNAPYLTQSKPFDPVDFESNSEQIKKTTMWVKPSGALPLSLFGEQEDKDTSTNVRNGSNVNLGYGSFSNSNKLVGVDSVNSNSKRSGLQSNGSGFYPNSGSPCVSRVQSLNYIASLNGEGQQIRASESSGLFSHSSNLSSANISSSNFVMSKSNLNGLNRTLSVDAVTSLNDQGLQINTKSVGLVFELNVSSSSENFTSSSFGVWSPDFGMSKSNQNGLGRTSSLDVSSILNDQGQNVGIGVGLIGVSSSSAVRSSNVGNADINSLKSNQTGLNRTLSLDGLTNLNVQVQQIKTENGGLVLNSNGFSSSANASSSNFGGWNFDFGGVGSTVERSNTSTDVGGLNSNFNAVGSSENLDDAHDNNDDDEDCWEFKEAYSISEVGDGNIKATSEAKEHETNAFSFNFHNVLNGSVDLFATSNGSATSDSKTHHAGDMQAYSSGFGNSLNSSIDLFSMPSQPIDLFATCNGISTVHPDNMFGFDIEPSMASKNVYISASDGRGEQKESNGALDPHPVGESVESDEDFGEFTTASSDSGLKLEEEWKVNNVAHSELQASESDDKDQVKESKLENHKGALPLSIFGNEELEIDGSSNTEDNFVLHNASYSKNNRSPDSNISINDLISNLFSQAEPISPVHSVQVPNSISDGPQDSVSNSSLLNGEDDLDDGEWEFKDGSSQIRLHNDISLLTLEDPPQRSFSNLILDDYLDLYSKLRNELCYHAKRHLDRARSIDGLQVEEAKISTLDKEIEEACKDFDQDNAMCKGDQLEGHLSHNACMGAFIEKLQESKFQILESEYHLSRRLSLVENDLETTVDLIRHATMMLKILRSGSLEEQTIYVSNWYKMISVCAQELQHGSCIWKKILEMNAQSHVFSHPRGRAFIRALGEIYRVTVVLEASVKLCKPWTWLDSTQRTSIHSMLDECHTIWSSSGLGEALSCTLDSSSGDGSSVASLLDSIKLIHGLDALTLQKHLYAKKEVCRLSLLTLEVLPGMELIDWNGEHYFLTLANLWANLISSEPPELPKLIIGW